MDLFYQSLLGECKQCLYFYCFMLCVYEELIILQGYSDLLEIVVDCFKVEIDVFCFDEFFVFDIIDVMLLGGLMKVLFVCGIILVVIFNILLDEFYCNGLQWVCFLLVIDVIKQYCDIMNVDVGIDY